MVLLPLFFLGLLSSFPGLDSILAAVFYGVFLRPQIRSRHKTDQTDCAVRAFKRKFGLTGFSNLVFNPFVRKSYFLSYASFLHRLRSRREKIDWSHNWIFCGDYFFCYRSNLVPNRQFPPSISVFIFFCDDSAHLSCWLLPGRECW